MIYRNSKININSSEVRMNVCFSSPDIRRWVRMFIELCTHNDPDLLPTVKAMTIYEADIRRWMERDTTIFGTFENPWRTQLSAWAWNRMVKENYVYPSSTREDGYLFTERAFTKPGRPKLSSEV